MVKKVTNKSSMYHQATGSSLFSVIIPTFNRAELIADALDSVLAQSYQPVEVIIVDDGSTDRTGEVVKKWKAQMHNNKEVFIRYIYQVNAGAGAARNHGIQEIQGEYVQFLDSDDRLHPERLQRLVETFEREQCDFIQTGFDGFNAETGETIEIHYGRQKDDLISQALMGVLWPNTLRSAFRRTLVEKIGPWNTEMICFEDYEYVIRALIHSNKPKAIWDILASARRGGGARVSDRLKTYEGRYCRIQCEKLVSQLAQHNHDSLSDSARSAFVTRLYNLGVRSYASGWNDLGAACGNIALTVSLPSWGIQERKWYYLWRLGSVGGQIYKWWQFWIAGSCRG